MLQTCRPGRIFAMLLFATAFHLLSAQNTPEKQRVLVLGDSLTAGYGIGKDRAFPALLQERIDALGLPFEMVNAGVSGDTSAGGLARLNWVLKRPIAVLILELGANDGLRGLALEATEQNLRAILDRTRETYPDVKLVIAGMKLPPNLGEDYTTGFAAIFARLADDYDATLIPFLLEGVAGRPQYNLEDGIHPTEEGHRMVAETVWPYLKRVLTPITSNN